MKDLKGHIYVAAHEVCELPHDNLYIPIYVGAFSLEPDIISRLPDYFLRDDRNENISSHNDCLSELTGLYWIWKNREDSWLGLTHYRRYFAFHRPFGWPFRKAGFEDMLTEDQLEKLMGRGAYDMILPRKRHYVIETLYSHYSHTFDHRHLDSARMIIRDLYPACLPAFDRVMSQRSGYMFNMMIMKRETLDSYCSWLFPILFELEKREMKEGMNDYQKRFGGRVAERLLNVWLEYQLEIHMIDRSRICELPVLRTDRIHWIKKSKAFLMARFFHRPYRRSW